METGTESKTEKNYWSSAVHHIEKYVVLQFRLYKMQLIEKMAMTGSAISSSLITSGVLVMSLMFIMTGVAFLIGEYSGHTYIGFAAVGGFFLLSWLILKASKKGLRKKILDFYLRKAFDHEQ